MILEMLAIKAYVGKSKINSAKKLLTLEIETGTLELMVTHLVLYSHAFLTELTWPVLSEGYLTLLLLVH